MSVQVSGRSAGQSKLTDNDLGRYILHYLMSSRGICEENVLLIALMRLCDEPVEEAGEMDIEGWQKRLSDVIKRINLKLNGLDYKVVQISHGMGKNIVASKSKEAMQFCSRAITSPGATALSATNRFYVYIDVGAVEETKLATRFSQKEVDFIKHAIQKTCESGFNIRQGEVSATSAVVQEVDRVRRLVLERAGAAFEPWDRYTTFAVGSSLLTQHRALNALEIEDMIIRLCEYKWFCRNEKGEISLDLRCIAELEDDLLSTYEFPACQNCNRLAIYGVMCLHTDDAPAMWHVDCYQYQIAHKDTHCTACGESLITNGVYVI
ncbi:hypothetical protein HG536_0E04080 [Torulaspora globosa]|uniref:Non-structural maintenance of chromosomes element 1 homolog n=1 Tax=Torulaspora globosa TaxID=48254 RepID=A0A7G3ZJ11_9SACH|nr:uncharacterized protein HG536_0E04080 [Torulaspora globosa]QLL33497.1 hypothetical protein HG536_0E04080 [Torulaspora globosa]